MEDFAVDKFAEAGFEAELDILSVSETQAEFSNIHITRGGQPVISLKALQLDYIWPDVRDFRFKRIEIDGASAALTLNEDWQPADDWIRALMQNLTGGSAGTGGGNKFPFPDNGFGVTNSVMTVTSPLGETQLDLNAQILTPNEFSSELSLSPTNLSYGGYAATGTAQLTLEGSKEEIRVQGRAQTDSFSNGKLTIENANMVLDGRLKPEVLAYAGDISVEGETVSSDLFAADAAQLNWSGDISKPESFIAVGDWSVDVKRGRTPRAARADELAETLSLYSAVSVVPVTEHYAPELKQMVNRFLLGSDVQGSGRFDIGPSGFTLAPDSAVVVQNTENRLRLVPRIGSDFFAFDRTDKLISAGLDAAFDSPVGMKMNNIHLKAKSENGIRLDGIERFSADFMTRQNWNAKAEDGRPVRLGPLEASLNYIGGIRPRRLSIETAVDYDGDLPGGRVMGLALDGRLDVRLYTGRQRLDFTPVPSSQISLNSMETPTDWRIEDFSFTLPPTENLFTRADGKSNFAGILQSADFTLTQAARGETKAQRLEFQSESLTVDGTLLSNSQQDWIVDLEAVQYQSETLPGPRTTGSAQQANLTAQLMAGQSPRITLISPSITAETPLVRVSDFEIALTGTPEQYEIDHQGGTVDVIGSEFAQSAEAAGLGRFPANGQVEFKDGRFIGQSKLVVAKANDADVNVSYEYADGAGTARIDVPSILFEPKGLQPQSLVPAFRGKIARVEGEARAAFDIGFADGALTSSSGTVDLVDMAVGTAPGPLTGLNTTLEFTSLWPLETKGSQELRMEEFNPGMPLKNGVVVFDLLPEGVKVKSADWPIGNGSFSLDPFIWTYAAEENRVIMRVKDVALGDFLNGIGNSRIEATGNVVGVFPIVVRGIEVLIEEGEISVPGGGVIKYDPGPNVPNYSQEDAIDVLRQQRTSEYALLAQDALREFEYRELSASLDGPLDGDVEIGLIFDGANEKVLNQQPFRFDISVKGELFNIARSFNSNAQVKAEIMRQNGSLPEGTIIGE